MQAFTMPSSTGAQPAAGPVQQRQHPASSHDLPMQVLWHLIALVGIGLILRLVNGAVYADNLLRLSMSTSPQSFATVRAIVLAGGLWFLLRGTRRDWLIGGLIMFVWVLMAPAQYLFFQNNIAFRLLIRSLLIALLYAVGYTAGSALCYHFLFRRQMRKRRAFLSMVVAIAVVLVIGNGITAIRFPALPGMAARVIFSPLLAGGTTIVAFLGIRWLARTPLSGRIKLSAWGYVWCSLCLAANVLTLISSIAVRGGRPVLGMQSLNTILLSLAVVAAFVLLLFGKRGGWFLLLTVALLQACPYISRFINGAVLEVVLPVVFGAAINAIITWFSIRPAWIASASIPDDIPYAFDAQSQILEPTPYVPQTPVRSEAQVQAAGSGLSLRYLRCPQCGSYDVDAKGLNGALGRSVATGLAFGAVGNLVANSKADDRVSAEPMQYQCQACRNTFEFLPAPPEADELLPAPATIEFTRDGSMLGAAVQQFVFLNGLKVGAVKNGKTISFTTNLRYNTLFVTDHFGVAFKGMYRFEALPGMVIPVHFNQKFRQ